MKHVLIIMMMLLTVVGFSQNTSATLSENAKVKMSMEEELQMKVNRLGDKLELSDEQEAKIYALKLEKAKKREALTDAKKAEMKKNKDAFKTDRENYNARMKEILTADQYVKWEQMKKDKKKHHKGKKFDKNKKEQKNRN